MNQAMKNQTGVNALRVTHNPLPHQQRVQSVDILAMLITDILDVASSVRHVQWNKYPSTRLAGLFDAASNALQGQARQLAQRVTALGGFVPVTANMIARFSTIEAFPEHPLGKHEFEKALIIRFEQLAKSAQEALQKADNLNDPVTSYHLTQTAAEIEKQLSVFEHAFAPAS